MAIVGHVGGDEGPLRKLLVMQVTEERSEILDQLETGGVLGDGIVEDQRIMFADIVVRICPLIREVVPLEARVRHGLLIFSP